jgi:hypothetical protein
LCAQIWDVQAPPLAACTLVVTTKHIIQLWVLVCIVEHSRAGPQTALAAGAARAAASSCLARLGWRGATPWRWGAVAAVPLHSTTRWEQLAASCVVWRCAMQHGAVDGSVNLCVNAALDGLQTESCVAEARGCVQVKRLEQPCTVDQKNSSKHM